MTRDVIGSRRTVRPPDARQTHDRARVIERNRKRWRSRIAQRSRVDTETIKRRRREDFVGRRLWQAVTLAVVSLVSLVAFGLAGNAFAHVIMGKKSIHLSVAEASLVVRGRVIEPQSLYTTPDGSKRRHLVVVAPLETIKGSPNAERIRVAHDGHEAPAYELGDEAIFFLDAIETSRELRSLATPGGATHVSGQEHDEAYRVEPPHGDVLLSSIRAFASSETTADLDARVALIRGATLDLLTCGDPTLGAAALAGMVLAPHAALVTRSDLPRLEKMLETPSTSVGLKAGLIAELSRRGFIEGPAHWQRLLESARPAQLRAAIRAVGPHASEPIRTHLLALLASPETEPTVAAEAAIALGGSPTHEVIQALARALDKGAPRVRNAAIRALGRIPGPEARRVLERASEEHPDPATRRRAGAAANTQAARSAKARAEDPQD